MVAGHQGNVESGRMTRLGTEFCVMMLAQVPEGKLNGLNEALKKIEGTDRILLGIINNILSLGLTIVTHKTSPSALKSEKTRQRVVNLHGADQIGTLNKITEYFEKNNINIDDMATFSGTQVF